MAESFDDSATTNLLARNGLDAELYRR